MKVSGKNLVKSPIFEFAKNLYLFDFVGDPDTTRTCDLLLRRPWYAFFLYFASIRKQAETNVQYRVEAIRLRPAKSSKKPLFSKVSGKNLVNAVALIFGPDPPWLPQHIATSNTTRNQL